LYPKEWDLAATNRLIRSSRTTREMAASELLKHRLSEGILAFPATPFKGGGIDTATYSAHIADLVAGSPVAIVPAGGAGEIFSLSPAEQDLLVRAAVEASGEIPVIAGAGQGVSVATAMARAAERAGVAAVLLFPPYLVTPEQEGLAAYVEEVCRSVSIPVIAYSRDNGVLTPDTALRLAERCPNLIAVKDGTGDFEALVTLKRRAGDRLTLINGVPTAEMIAAQCLALGVRSYTSAVFTFLPTVANRFYQALRAGDQTTVDLLLAEFYVPLSAIRRRKRGYAVAIVKAGLRLAGKPVGGVRPPLVGLSPADDRDLAALIGRATDLLGEAPRRAAVGAVG
jgi:5-dehydro-4-deoxyglucarate dehydratase